MAKLAITGVSGFVGQHLAALAKDAWEVHGIGFSPTANDTVRKNLASYYGCDLTDKAAVQKLPLSEYDVIVHLAGLASPAESFAEPAKFIADNTAMLINLCEPLVAAKAKTRVIMVSSGAVYDGSQPMPLTEMSATAAANPYVVSKLAMEELAAYYRARGLGCVVVRPFNHIGPGQLPGYLVPDLIAKLRAYQTSGEPLKVGNLTTRRDYTDVRDVARAYLALAKAESLKSSAYNVCSGKSYSGQEILQLLAKTMGVDLSADTVQVDQSLIRPTDIAEIYGSSELLQKETGWQPSIPIEQTLKDAVAAA